MLSARPLITDCNLHCRCLLFFLLASIALVSHAANNTGNTPTADRAPIKLGILPYLSGHALVKEWKPFVDAIATTFSKNVILKTAPNFKSYLHRSIEGRYDIVVTAPHFAALLVREHKFEIIAGFSNPLSGDIVVAENSPYHSLNEIKEKTLATPDKLAIISILGELKVRELGLVPGNNVKIKYTPSHNTALLAVLEGKADYAVAVGGLYKKLSRADRRFRLITHTRSVPHVMVLAHPGLTPEDLRLLSGLLLNGNKNGALKMQPQPGWGKFVHVDARSLGKLDRTLPILRSRLLE